MRRSLRILRGLATVVSTVLLLATLAAWVRGRWATEYVALRRDNTTTSDWVTREWGVPWGGGDVGFCYAPAWSDGASARSAGCPPGVRWERTFRTDFPFPVGRKYVAWAAGWVKAGHRAAVWDHAGVVAGHAQAYDWSSGVAGANVANADRRYYWLVVRCWLAAAVFGALPARQAYAWSRRRQPPGHCRRCGYDLRATPERCPECGAAASVITTTG